MNFKDSQITYDIIAKMVIKSKLPTSRIHTVYRDLVEQYALSEENDYLINQIKRSLV